MEIITRAEAKAKGLKWYFTGKPCSRGHVEKRWVSIWSCAACQRAACRKYNEANREARREAARKYREANLEAERERGRKYYEANLEAEREYARKYYAANREARREYARKYYAANREAKLERSRKYREANLEAVRERGRKYYEANRESYAARAALRRATELKAIPLRYYQGDTESARRALQARHHAAIDAGSEAFCDYVTPGYVQRLGKLEALKMHFSEAFGIDFHLDHHIPLSRGGEHAPENLVIMPGATNLAKGDKLPGTEWTPPAPVFERLTIHHLETL